jgi:hypothetical protein
MNRFSYQHFFEIQKGSAELRNILERANGAKMEIAFYPFCR